MLVDDSVRAGDPGVYYMHDLQTELSYYFKQNS